MLLQWIPTIIVLCIPIAVFAGRNWLQASIVRRVQFSFDKKLETIRADLRDSEERLKSELRTREAEISTLRESILTGRAQRQALLDQRRLDAVERLWTRVSTTLGAYKSIAVTLGTFKFDAVAKEATKNAKMRLLFTMLISHISEDDMKTGNMNAEQIYLSPLAWACFSAYQTILYVAYALAKVLSAGLDDPSKLITMSRLQDILKSVLPHRAEYIDSQPFTAYHHLLGEIEDHILAELKVMLEGREDTQAAISHAMEIMEQVNKLQPTLDLTRANAAVESEVSPRGT